jgi:hypothetical protein
MDATQQLKHHTEYFWQSDCLDELLPALLKFHQLNVVIKKDRVVPVTQTKTRAYTSLDEIFLKIKPALASCDLIIMQHLAGPDVITMLSHKNGQFIASRIAFVPMNGNNVNALQQAGGGYTYLKRYAISALLAINADEDDDGDGQTEGILPKLTDDKIPEVKKFLANNGTIDQVKRKYQITKQQLKLIENDTI